MAKAAKKTTTKKATTVKKSTRISKSEPKTTKATKTTPKATPKKAPAKAPVVKKVNAKSNKAAPMKTERSTTTKQESKCLEVCLLLDETASMMSWIEGSKETIKGIIENIKKDYEGLKVRVSFIGYRDINDKPRFEIFDFSEDLDACT